MRTQRVQRVRQPLLDRGDGGIQIGLFPGPTWLAQAASATERLVAAAEPNAVSNALKSPAQHPLLGELLSAGVLDASAADPEDRAAVSPAANAALGHEREWLAAQVGNAAAIRSLARRRRAGVEIRGGGRCGALVATLLAAAGVGRLRLVDDEPASTADDFPGVRHGKAQTRGEAATKAALAAGPDLRVLGPEGSRELVVLADGSDLDPATVDPLMRAGTPHLVVATRAHHVQVGPLVVPNRTGCLTCWAHTRTDADPAWPFLTAQLAHNSSNAIAVPAVAIAAGYAAAAALRHLDDPGRNQPAEVTWLLNGTDDPIRRPVRQHPLCGCSWSTPAAA